MDYGLYSKMLLDQKLKWLQWKNMKIKFNSDNDLCLKKILELSNMILVVDSVFHEDSKYYPQVFFDDCLYKL